MQMQRAFHSKMMTKLICYTVSEGSYDEENVWVEGTVTQKNIWGVIQTGNKFSKLDEGEALHTDDGGERFSNFRTLYVSDKFVIGATDKFLYQGLYFNVLQRSDEATFGFNSVLIEKTLEWTP